MSRIANNPISIPKGVEVNISKHLVTIKGTKGELTHNIHPLVKLEQVDDVIKTSTKDKSKFAKALSGTTRALVQNIITGVSEGFERKLEITGVGYRAAVSGKTLNLTLGFSHPVVFQIPDGVTIETPSQTEIVIKGNNKQQVGQVAANIRAYRPPEPYKGKGVRYSDERIVRKEAKKS
ncbi:MAG: 50S ribosomal protein L6 [Legionellales bacterium]|nr:50S ribosomal protein L6 [Legionellales bacterium]|tara:strand:- start:566 stop:1099 length:534 start_codon:yes stop_codon:yes gene_type:complete